MPTATQDQQSAVQGKKRWHEDTQQPQPQQQKDTPRKPLAVPNPKRTRRGPTGQYGDYERLRSRSTSKSPPRELHEIVGLDCKPVQQLHQIPAPAQLLSRCHICHRKPTKKADLDSFADCQGCGQRTCFVCIRQCLDWRPDRQKRWNGYGSASFHMKDADDVVVARDGEENEVVLAQQQMEASHENVGEKEREVAGWVKLSHHQMVCSRCCVEKGPDGDVVCLGCLPFVES